MTIQALFLSHNLQDEVDPGSLAVVRRLCGFGIWLYPYSLLQELEFPQGSGVGVGSCLDPDIMIALHTMLDAD